MPKPRDPQVVTNGMKSSFVAKDGRILIKDFSSRQMELLAAWRAGYRAHMGETDLLILDSHQPPRKGRINLNQALYAMERDKFLWSVLTDKQKRTFSAAKKKA